MAGGDVEYRLVVNSSGAVKSLQTMDQAFNKANTSAKRMGKTISENNNRLGMQERSANLAGAAALELSRVASDAAYGLRGMANNIGQLITMFAMMMTTTNAATGAALGFAGSLKAIWRAMMGPLGIVIAIQGLLSVLTLLENRTRKASKEWKEFKETLGDWHSQSIQTVALLNAIRKAMSSGVSDEAKKELESLIPNYEKLSKIMSDDQLLGKYGRYLKLKENEEMLQKTILEQNEIYLGAQKKMNEAWDEGGGGLEEQDKWLKRSTRAAHNRANAERILAETLEERLKLERLFREEEGERDKKFKYEKRDLLDKMLPTNSDVDKRFEAIFDALSKGEQWARQQIDKLGEMGMSKLQARQLAEINTLRQNFEEASKALGDEPEAKQEALELQDQYLTAVGKMRIRHSIESHQEEMSEVQRHNDELVAADKARLSKQLANERRHQEELRRLRQRALDDAKDMLMQYQVFDNDLKMIEVENYYNARLRNAKTDSEFDQIQLEKDRAMFEAQKKAAISEAYIKMAMGVVDIWSKYAAAPPIAAALSAAHIAVSMKQIQAIKSQQFAGDISPPGGLGASAGGSLPEAQVTGFSNLQGGENPYQAIRVNVLEHDVRTTQDKVKTLKVRSRL